MNVLDEQLAYYRARALEYDAWWERRGRYSLGEEGNAIWWREVEEIRAVLARTPLEGELLELAPGTGVWTEILAARAARLTAVDAAAEMIAVCREKLSSSQIADRVRFIEADLFAWQPDRRYDGVFFGHWLSHVPLERLDAFLAMVASALRPGGTLMFVDSRGPSDSSWTKSLDEEHVERELLDGRRFRIVKRYDAH
ncbi:MAG TPA: class I SAM-dependent methyltransferase, partial [Polyangiaceae bacterium]|nr:class I SAM-dependent methyltransferase [Polyangiaceae bacterium]